MKKIVKQPEKVFYAQCNACSCVFTYETDDMSCTVSGDLTVICPACNYMFVKHSLSLSASLKTLYMNDRMK